MQNQQQFTLHRLQSHGKEFVRQHVVRASDHIFRAKLPIIVPKRDPAALSPPQIANNRSRLEHAFRILSNGGETIPTKELKRRLTAHKAKLQLTSREIKQLLICAEIRKDRELSQFDLFRVLASREMSRNSAKIRRLLFKTADLIAMPGPRTGPVTMSYETKYTCIPPPIFILSVTIAQVVAYTYFCRHDHVVPTWNSGCPGCYSDLVFNPFRRAQAWRYISYSLMHAGAGHIFMNLLIQVFLGVPLEMVHKPWRIGPIYIAGAVTGAMLQYSLNPNVVLVGASGAVYALLAAHISNLIINWTEMPLRLIRAAILASFIVLDVGQSLWYHYHQCKSGQGSNISNLAHIGGSITGLILGIVLLRNLRRLRWEKYLQAASAVCFVAYVAALISLNVLILPGSHSAWKAEC